MVAILAGLLTFIGLNIVLGMIYGIACSTSPFMHMLLRFSYLAWPIKIAAWFGAAWVGLSVWDALA